MAKFVNSYLDENLIIFRGLQRGGAIGKGYNIEMPDTENTDASWLMALEDNLRVLLRMVRPDDRASPWYKRVHLIPPMATRSEGDSQLEATAAARNGENGWIMLIEREARALSSQS